MTINVRVVMWIPMYFILIDQVWILDDKDVIKKDMQIYEDSLSSGANGDREIFIFPVQLITSRIGNRLILTFICYVIM